MDTVRSRGLSIVCDDDGEGTSQLESTRWRGRSIGFGMERCLEDESMTLSLRFSASDADLVGMGLQYIPASPKRKGSKSSDVHRVLKLKVGPMRTLRGQGGRFATFFSVLMWLIGSATVAALAAVVVPRVMEQSYLATSAPRAAVLNRAATWEEVQRKPLSKPLFGGLVEGALFSPEVLQGCVDTASEAIDALRTQLSPLSTEAQCLRSNAVPDMPVAAVGLASAVASVLTAKPVELALEDAKGASISGIESLDIPRAITSARLCGMGYVSCDEKDSWLAAERLEEELEGVGLQLVREIHGGSMDEYAYVARNVVRGEATVVFRGSCTLKNVLTDIDMVRGGAEKLAAAEKLAEATGMPLAEMAGADMTLHHGFVDAYLAVREELLETLVELSREHELAHGVDSPPLDVHITGHSMGGAIAMLAAIELEHLRREHHFHVAKPQTYTFAAPRLGDAFFADLFTRTFPEPSDHWALQAPSDAVPHLPFSAWGFRHPEGVAKLGENAEANCTPALRAAALRRSADVGDSVHRLRPKDGDLMNWAFCHDLSVYIDHLQAMVADLSDEEAAMPLPAAA